jgi:hypothetical protein
MESEAIVDGVLAQDETQLQSLWSIRESIPEAAGKLGKTYKYDVSMPVDKMNELVDDMRKRFQEKDMLGKDKKVLEVVGFGHIGDGNLHLNVVAAGYDEEVEAVIEPWVYEWIAKVQGSISAEHGLGRMKGEKIGYSKSATSVSIMKDIKNLFDPDNIMNPYKVSRNSPPASCCVQHKKLSCLPFLYTLHSTSLISKERIRWGKRTAFNYPRLPSSILRRILSRHGDITNPINLHLIEFVLQRDDSWSVQREGEDRV